MSDCKKRYASEVSELYPHIDSKRLSAAAKQGIISRSKRKGDYYYVYHLDEDFERWQAKYLSREPAKAEPLRAVLSETITLPARMEREDPVASRLRGIIVDRAAEMLLERAGLLSSHGRTRSPLD